MSTSVFQDEYRSFRGIFAAKTDVFLVCFSLSDPVTLDNVKREWLTEIQLLTPKAPFVLVGTKSDLRTDEETLQKLKARDLKPISTQEGFKVAKANGARAYVECSALKGDGLQKVFETVVDVATGNIDEKLKQEKCKVS